MSAIASRTPTTPNALPSPRACAACPVGLIKLLASSVFWLFVSLALGFVNSLKFHAPGLLANQSYFTYGRLHAAQNATFLYGFGVQAAVGIGLWLLCRLGRTTVACPIITLVGAILWNAAVTLGTLGILCGGSTGYESFEMPSWSIALLLIAYVMLGVCGLLTFHQREPGRLYPSQWFVVGALFWFPWIFSTAALTLVCLPSRGILQALTAWWYAHNLETVFLGFAGLASTFYFIPKLLSRPLHSHYQAALAFWTLALFGSCGGVPVGAPLPSWVTSLCVVGSVMMAIPILTIAANFYQTVRKDINALDNDPTLRFVYIGLFFWVIASVQQIVGAIPTVSVITDFTWFGVAQKELFRYGFFAMTAFGAMYYIIPRLLDLDSAAWCPKLLKWHFLLTFLGVLIAYLSLIVAGLGQGILLANGANSFVDVMHRTMMPFRTSTIGDLFILIGTALFAANLTGLLAQACRKYCCVSGKGAR